MVADLPENQIRDVPSAANRFNVSFDGCEFSSLFLEDQQTIHLVDQYLSAVRYTEYDA